MDKQILWIVLLICALTSSCFKAVENSSTQRPGESVAVNSGVAKTTQPRIEEIRSPANSKTPVSFDGKNYIKKDGWATPSKKNAYINEKYDQGDAEGVTKSGKKIRTKTHHYLIRPLWLHSQDFIYEGRELDHMKGKLEGSFFLETSAYGKVFLYSISVKKVETAPPSNGDNWEPFIYEIMDADGDGIFETLVGEYDEEIIVPNWVLK